MIPSSSQRSLARPAIIGLACCLFALVLGARWALIAHYGTDLPEWDQWDAEGKVLIVPAAHGPLPWATFWLPHNEHRIVLTRLMAFGLIQLNGQWDQRVEAACNALLPATIAAAFWLCAARRLARRWQLFLFGALAAVYALPLAFENTLSGFDSQQFFLIGSALGAIVLLPFAEPYRPKWWLGALGVLLSVGSMGSGFFAALVVGLLLVLQLERTSRTLRSASPGLVVCGVATAIGVMSRAIVAGHESLKAQTAGDFLLTLGKALGWPAFDFNWGYSALLLFLPWALLTWRVLRADRRRGGAPAWNLGLIGLGLWVVAQALATAYARGADGPSPAFRYMDTLIVGNLVNLLCLSTLWRDEPAQSAAAELKQALTIGWIFLFTVGAVSEARYVWTQQLPGLLEYHHYSELNVRHYLATRDRAYLHHAEIPYPGQSELAQMLDDPAIAARLPASVRLPLDAQPAASGPGFQREDSRVPERQNPVRSPGAGLSPGTPVLANAVTWGSYRASSAAAAAAWRSRPLQAAGSGWLKFELAGDPGQTGQEITLRDPASDRLLAEVRPDRSPGNTWRSAYVRAPRGPFVIAARSAGPGWLAFSQPVEISAGSWRIRRWVSAGSALAWTAGLGALVILALALRREGAPSLITPRSL